MIFSCSTISSSKSIFGIPSRDLFVKLQLVLLLLSIWDWLAGWIAAGHLHRWLDGLLQPYFVLSTFPRTSPCLGRSPLVCFACRWLCSWPCSSLPCCWLCSSLACCWLCSSACCWLCSSRFFSSFLPLSTIERCSASASSLRCTSRFPRTRVALLRSSFSPLTLWLWFCLGFSPLAPCLSLRLCFSLTTGFLAVALSLILSRDTLW